MTGVNDLTVWDGAVAKYVLPFTSTENYMIASYQQFELNVHKKYPNAQLLFGQLTGIELSRYAYTEDHDPLHQEIINNTIIIVNHELVKINAIECQPAGPPNMSTDVGEREEVEGPAMCTTTTCCRMGSTHLKTC